MAIEQAGDGMEDTEPPVERERRLRAFKGARAAFNQEHSAVSCVVRDLSETGAKIQFDVGWIVPSHFTLFIELDGFKVECEKVWHRGNLFGVRFIGPRMATNLGRRQRLDLCDMRVPAETCSAPALVPTPTIGNRPKRPVFGKLT